jgi:hypothetical protein
MGKIAEVLELLRQVSDLKMEPDLTATLQSAVLSEYGIGRTHIAAARQELQPALQLQQMLPLDQRQSRSRIRSTSEEREMFKAWMETEPAIAKFHRWIVDCVAAMGGVASASAVLECPPGRLRGYTEAVNVPTEHELNIITTMLGLDHAVSHRICAEALLRINQLRAMNGIRPPRRINRNGG